MRWTANQTADDLDCLQRYHRDARDLFTGEMEIGFDVKPKGSDPRSCSWSKGNAAGQLFRGVEAPIDIGPMPVPPVSICANNHAPHSTVDNSRCESTTAR